MRFRPWHIVLLGALGSCVSACGSERKFVDPRGNAGEGGEGTGGTSGASGSGGSAGSTTGGSGGTAGEGGEAGTSTGGSAPTGGTGGSAGEGGEGGVPEPPPTVSPPGQNITSASGRMTSATYTLEVQLGFGYGQQRSASATYQLEGNAAIKP